MAHLTTVVSGKEVEIDQFQIYELIPEVIKLLNYRLVYVDGDLPKSYRLKKGMNSLGLIFKYPTHWSNGVDRIKYAEAEDAALALDDWRKIGHDYEQSSRNRISLEFFDEIE